MISLTSRSCASGLMFAALMVSAGSAAEQPRTQSGKAIPPAQRPSTTKSGARGPLPDPVILDGSTHSPEKKSEYGMIGDFELPGDENVKNGKVGGAQGGGQQQQQNQSGGGGMPMGLPQAGGAGGQQPPQQAAKAGGAGQQGEQQPGGQQNPNAQGNPVPGGGDPNAKAEGIQVAQLGGE